MYRRTIKEEHISVISEPGGKYIGHVTPKKETANEIADSIYEQLERKEFDISAVEAIGCDGTVTNTDGKAVLYIPLKLSVAVLYNGLSACYISTSYLIGICLITWMERQQDQFNSAVQLENNSLAVRNSLL
uniref:Uncharacterized protein LOC114343228 n=1 Tax=Diabrotica virgifera virgifera TaxID=50390 RepID=A0A6P7GJK8_DIAVI